MGAIAACPFGSEIVRILGKMFGFSTFPSSFGLHWSPFCNKTSSEHSQSVVLIGQKTKAFQLPSVNKGAVPVAMLLLPDFDYTLGRTIAGAGQLKRRADRRALNCCFTLVRCPSLLPVDTGLFPKQTVVKDYRNSGMCGFHNCNIA